MSEVFKEDNSYKKFGGILSALKESINCQLPCQVIDVKGNEVDVLIIRNDEIEDIPIYGVPIKRDETGRAYIFLGTKKGDWGTLRFYDKSIEDYRKGNLSYNGDDRCHDLNDCNFELGFIPDPEAFVYPEKGNKNIFKIINNKDEPDFRQRITE